MKKKLICLGLSLIMLLSVCLTGCGEKTSREINKNISEKASASAETLAMYLMSEEPVSEATATRIQNAVNEITEAKFKTRLKLYFYTEEEYYEKLETAFADRAEAKANNTLMERAPVDEDDNFALIRYPEIADYQVDLFYLGGMERYYQYKQDGLLANMESYLSTSAKQITQYISSNYFDALRLNGNDVCAIPNNRAIGEYTYLLVNKEALQDTYLSASGITSLTHESCQTILSLVNESATLREKFVPLWTNVENVDALIANLQTIGADENGALSNEFSLMGTIHGAGDVLTSSDSQNAMISNLLENTEFQNALRTLKQYELSGYYGTDADQDKAFAVGVVQGGAELVEVYGDDYEMVVIETPRMNSEDVYGHMMAVSAYSSRIERSMQILTYLTTNEDFRNLLLYGVEGENYQLIDTGVAKDDFGNNYEVVRRIDNSYIMAPEKTGNTFITYQLESDHMVYNLHEYGVLQNKAVKTSLTLGLSLNYAGTPYVDSDGMKALRELSAEIWADYLAITDMSQFDDVFEDDGITLKTAGFWTASQKKFAENEAVSSLLPQDKHDANTCGGACGGLRCYHKAWLKSNGITLK